VGTSICTSTTSCDDLASPSSPVRLRSRFHTSFTEVVTSICTSMMNTGCTHPFADLGYPSSPVRLQSQSLTSFDAIATSIRTWRINTRWTATCDDLASASSPVRFQLQSLTSFTKVATGVWPSDLVSSFVIEDWFMTVTFLRFHSFPKPSLSFHVISDLSQPCLTVF
jgi:hypothetical protein